MKLDLKLIKYIQELEVEIKRLNNCTPPSREGQIASKETLTTLQDVKADLKELLEGE